MLQQLLFYQQRQHLHITKRADTVKSWCIFCKRRIFYLRQIAAPSANMPPQISDGTYKVCLFICVYKNATWKPLGDNTWCFCCAHKHTKTNKCMYMIVSTHRQRNELTLRLTGGIYRERCNKSLCFICHLFLFFIFFTAEAPLLA